MEINKETTAASRTLYITASEATTEELESSKASAVDLGMSMSVKKLEINKVSVTKLDMPASFEIYIRVTFGSAILGRPVS